MPSDRGSRDPPRALRQDGGTTAHALTSELRTEADELRALLEQAAHDDVPEGHDMPPREEALSAHITDRAEALGG